MVAPVLILDNVGKSYRTSAGTVAAVSGATAGIRPGEVVALFGPSGSGKTTLLNLAATIDTPDQGDVSLVGQNIKALSETERATLRARHVGFVFQSFNLVQTLTALENVALALAPTEPSRSRRNAAARHALTNVGLSDRMHHLPKQLSGGQQQRVGVARALAKTPAIVFADEPSANLDSATTRSLLELIAKLAESGIAFLICTHDVQVQRAATKHWTMHDGHLRTDAEAPQ